MVCKLYGDLFFDGDVSLSLAISCFVCVCVCVCVCIYIYIYTQRWQKFGYESNSGQINQTMSKFGQQIDNRYPIFSDRINRTRLNSGKNRAQTIEM